MEELEAQIDALLQRSHRRERRKGVTRKVVVTDANARRVFGMSLWDLFRQLADRFGYAVEEDEPPVKP